MTRIVLVIGQLGLGGAEKQLCLLAAGLSRWNYKPLVIALNTGGQREGYLRTRGIETVVLSRNGSFDVKRLLQIVKILRHFKPDVVYGFDSTGSIYGRLAGVIAGVPILIAGMRFAEMFPKKLFYAEQLLRYKTDIVVSNSFAGKQIWTKLVGYPEEKVVVVPNGFDFEEMESLPRGFRPLRELLGLPSGTTIVGCIGSVYDLKNPLMFVDVAASVISNETEVHFVWIGDGPMRKKVEHIIGERGLAEKVHMLGSRRDAAWLAQDFHVGIMTSVVEGMPNAIMEYMFWGVPVVTTDAGGCSELVEHERTGFVVGKNDAVAMTACIQKLLQDQSSASKMGRQGRERLKKEFSTELMLQRAIAIYESVKMRKRLSARNTSDRCAAKDYH